MKLLAVTYEGFNFCTGGVNVLPLSAENPDKQLVSMKEESRKVEMIQADSLTQRFISTQRLLLP